MARGRQTELAVLGALSVQPMTGYAVREEIRQVLGHFWSESYGQIYPALAELQRDGLIEAQQGAAGFGTEGAAEEEPEHQCVARRGRLVRLA